MFGKKIGLRGLRKIREIFSPAWERLLDILIDTKVTAHWNIQELDPVTKEVVVDHGWHKNVITADNKKLIAALNAGQAGYSGITYLAVGEGEDDWDVNGTPSPAASTQQLVSELARKAVTIHYINAANNQVGDITNRLSVSAIFGANEANGNHREYALFGGDATATADSGIMINYETHTKIEKDSTRESRLTVRITYS